MKLLSILLFLITLLLSFHSAQANNSTISTSEKVFIHGLDHVDISFLKDWTQSLYLKKSTRPVGKVKDLLLDAYYKSSNTSGFIKNIMNLRLHQKYENSSKYKELAEGIFATRREIRKDLEKNSIRTRQVMLVLETLAEEVLYVREVIFQEHKPISFNYSQKNSLSACQKRIATLNGIKTCQGDIVLSKGGAGSSSFLARITDYPGNFSHSTIAFVSKINQELSFIEAFIEDGVKLRSPEKDYVKSKKVKLFIYRSKEKRVISKSLEAVDQFIQMMKVNLHTNDLEELKKNASYPYDFAMDAEEIDKLFCSEVVYQTYKLTVSNNNNPYNKKLWGKVESPCRKIFLSRFLDSKTTFPSPSDVELNNDYQLISMQFNPRKLSKDRIIIALTDAIMKILITNKSYVESYIDQLGPLGTEIVEPDALTEKLMVLSKLFGFKVSKETLQAMKKIPENINYKQLVFFSYLDQQLTPKVLKQIRAYEKYLLQNGQILDLLLMREVIYPAVDKELKDFMAKIKELQK